MPSIIKIPLNDALTQQPIVFKLIPGNCSCYILQIQREAANHSGFIQSDLRADIIVLTQPLGQLAVHQPLKSKACKEPVRSWRRINAFRKKSQI